MPAGTSFNPYQQYFSPAFASKVDISSALRPKLESFFNAFIGLSQPDRNLFINKFKLSQDIEAIVEDISFDGDQLKLSALPQSIRSATDILFMYLYSSVLPSYGKKEHYEILYNQTLGSICPFCGIETIGNPDYRCQDYDHILYKDVYPLAAVNMRNLIPMGIECNRNHKKTKDVLYGGLHRRKFIYSYLHFQEIRISLTGSLLPYAGRKGKWRINLLPNNGFTRTWNKVFDIKDRYRKDELEQYFDIWVKWFKDYLKSDRGVVWNENLTRNEFARMGEAYIRNPKDVSNIVKGALFLFISTTTDQAFIQATVNELNS
ncbi:hypothetical protein [Mucilaginibacter paludis]|uniref:hypothetical protein n=1 Tax=Mucilaginibacter paludis TaxID=423351 RepID=UPI0012F93736|nr:hypothetical protein [Mucilaginibacter paludis]